MPNPFSINVVTPAGAALIAQSTATNQIVFIGAKSATVAATDAADLAGKDLSFYDGADDGTIDACSATDNVAKIVARFGNTGGSAQIVKAVCILGRLANQTDAQAVIVAAMSDDASEIYLPSSASPTQIIRFPFNITINADEDVETAYADGATIADLARFVSMYKAGDPTQGEDQTILGEKTFVSGVVTIGPSASGAQLRCEEDDGQWSLQIGLPNSSTVSPQITLAEAPVDEPSASYITLDAAGIDIDGTCTVTGACDHVGGVNLRSSVTLSPGLAEGVESVWASTSRPGGTRTDVSVSFPDDETGKLHVINADVALYAGLTVDGAIHADGAIDTYATATIGQSGNTAQALTVNGAASISAGLSVGSLIGLAPTGGLSALPIGGIVVAFNDDWLSGVQLLAGARITVAANKLYATSLTGVQPSASGYLPAGDYILLSNSWTGVQNIPCLVMRVPPEV